MTTYKKCIFEAMFNIVLWKTPPCLNCIVLQLRYQTCWKPLQVTSTLFLEPNIQPSVRLRFFRSNFSKMPSSLDVSPLNSRPGQRTKKNIQQMQGCKIMLFVCRWLLIDPSKNTHKRMQNFIGFEKETCCSWHVAGNHGYLKENHVEWLGFFKLYGRFELKTDILLYQHGRPKKCKMAANRLKPREYAIFVKIVVCTKNLAT